MIDPKGPSPGLRCCGIATCTSTTGSPGGRRTGHRRARKAESEKRLRGCSVIFLCVFLFFSPVFSILPFFFSVFFHPFLSPPPAFFLVRAALWGPPKKDTAKGSSQKILDGLCTLHNQYYGYLCSMTLPLKCGSLTEGRLLSEESGLQSAACAASVFVGG